MSPPPVPASNARRDELNKQFRTHLRTAGRPFRLPPWHASGTGLICRPDDGRNWGHVVFREPFLSGRRFPVSNQIDPESPTYLNLRLFAGSLSVYLMEHANSLDPTKPPPANFVAANAHLVWSFDVGYTPDQQNADSEPAAFDARHPSAPWPTPTILGPDTVVPWLSETCRQLIPLIQSLSDDEAIRQWNLAKGREASPPARYTHLWDAAMLTWHLGLDTELPGILEEARIVREQSGVEVRDRMRHYPMYWSHKKFLKVLSELPR